MVSIAVAHVTPGGGVRAAVAAKGRVRRAGAPLPFPPRWMAMRPAVARKATARSTRAASRGDAGAHSLAPDEGVRGVASAIVAAAVLLSSAPALASASAAAAPPPPPARDAFLAIWKPAPAQAADAPAVDPEDLEAVDPEDLEDLVDFPPSSAVAEGFKALLAALRSSEEKLEPTIQRGGTAVLAFADAVGPQLKTAADTIAPKVKVAVDAAAPTLRAAAGAA
eukprot:CAMPEP_0182892676 /NCGR_PEP_ID=MMETSP0034_2-20130328/24015_1 /TAXON_ID=156128 /ORGANISM="Nephroselmis pyriformis, Strain CCMP717" /LENGTH=222 /DNA_ID=CAMNT_0025026375 /DNA_START=213 /DNA_END=878 /DNA_ORIENTATION=-